MQNTIERTNRASREQQRHDEFELQRRLTDELTEASEKLAMVMNNPFEFEIRDDGELYFQNGSVGDVVRNGVVVAEELVKHNPQFMTELIRQRIELQEYDDQRRLALGSDGDPDVLVVLSPIPDAVVAGVDLGAYDKKRMKTLARVYERTENGILSTSISLDRSDRIGLQAIARQFGQDIRDDDGSEDILAMRFWGYSSVLGSPVRTVRRRYDEQLERQYGGEWYGGRQDSEVTDSLTFIKQQKDIISAHMKSMYEIDEILPEDRKEARRQARYDFAAALDRRRHGGSEFGDGGDLSGSGEAARAAGLEYNSDCPTGEQTAQTATQAVNELYGRKESKVIQMTCPYCGLTTTGDPCAFRLVCSRCTAEVRGGKLISKGIGRTAALARETEQARAKDVQKQKQRGLKREIAKTAIPIVFENQNAFYERIETVGVGGMIENIREISRNEWYARREEYRIPA